MFLFLQDFGIFELQDELKHTLGNEYSWFLMSQIASFLKLVQVPIEENFFPCFQNFGADAEIVASICHGFLSPLFSTFQINVNTNGIEGRISHLRCHDANKGGKNVIITFK